MVKPSPSPAIVWDELPPPLLERTAVLSKIAALAPIAPHQFRLAPDGTTSMPFATPGVAELYGLEPEEVADDFSAGWARVHPDDRPVIEAAMAESARTLEAFRCEWRVCHPSRGELWVECHSMPEREPDGGVLWSGCFLDVTERRRAEEERRAHLELFECLDVVNRAIQGAADVDQMMGDVLEALLGLVDCDRAWLVYPCDPEAESWHVPMERTRPEYPGAMELGLSYPMDPEVAEVARTLLASAGPVTMDPGSDPPVPSRVVSEHSVRTMIAMALYPRSGKPWILGLHQCSRDRIWTLADQRMFREIGRRLTDGLTSLLAQRDLRESDERFRQMAENLHDVFWLTDADKHRVLYVSPAYESVWGRPRGEVYADPLAWIESVHPEDRRQVLDLALTRQAGGDYDVEYRVVQPDGAIRFVHELAFPIRDASGEVYRIAGVARDITARKEQEARLHYLAFHDALTDLPNRTLVMSRFEHALTQTQRQGRMLAVMFVDLDRFKAVNDTLGHAAGDAVLRRAGAGLAGALRESDTLGRVGGDEFLVVVPGLESAEDAAHVTERLMAALGEPIRIDNHEVHVTASFGISLYPRDALEPDALVKYADAALSLAKEQGRNRFRFFSPALDASVRARLRLESELRRAVDREQLVLHYQPQVSVATGELTGVEALVRWRHPERGLLMPGEFIPVAEEGGLIEGIGEWVLRTACARAQAWRSQGRRELRISVNVAGGQLERPDFAATVRRILDRTGLAPEALELEITESAVMSHPEETAVRLRELHEMGVRLALDDFGTGYSSLAHLKRFPLDRLKIDRSFVHGLPNDPDDTAIVQAIVAIARQLRLEVVAEGVETDTQRAFLAALGCDEVQGYLVGRPLPETDLEALVGLAGEPVAP